MMHLAANLSPDERAFEAALDALCLDIQTTEEAKALHAMLPSLRGGLTTAYLAGLRDGGKKGDSHG